MSLLMQALKKAERAKQNLAHDEELAKPSEAFDELLAIAPQEPSVTPSPAETSLSLSPMTDTPVETPAPEPVAPVLGALDFAPEPPPSPAPSLPPRDEPSLHTLEFAPDPAAPAPARPAPEATPKFRHAPESAPKPKRAPAAAAPRPPLDARMVRLAGLAGLALLVAGVFGYIYWQQVYGSGSSRNLPMVPMPGLDNPASGAPQPVAPAPQLTEVQPPAGEAGVPAYPAEGSYAPAPAATPAPAPATAAVPQGGPQDFPQHTEIPDQPSPEVVAHMQAQALAMPQAASPQAPAAAAPPVYSSEPVKVVRSRSAPVVNPGLAGAFAAYKGGDIAGAREQYMGVLKQDANNRDALLGMAALAIKDRQDGQAQSIYLRLLELDPSDADAIAGLAGARRGDPNEIETRLRRILQRTPDLAPIQFALGNLYAQQRRWQEAQDLYFRAYTASPDNADYAFNLAVGLDRLNQGRLALTYYQRALALAQGGLGNFDQGALRTRMRELGGQ